ncbi:MAG: hypothetical protein NTU43_08750 [Bacteroidetes bacterium]|nr:hypothetical protein [Bacteroidota bacterium]
MNQIYTEESLLRYIYKETTPTENAQIELHLKSNENFKKSYDEMLQTIEGLKEAELSPSRHSVNAILDYAKQHSSAEELA